VGRMPDKSRKLMEITEVLRKDNDIILNPIFKFDVDSNKLVKRGEIACGK